MIEEVQSQPPPDLGPVLAALDDHGVDYVVIGGVAGIAHGSSYPTYDIDIAYAHEPANIARLVGALRELDVTLRVAREPGASLPFQLDERSIQNGANFAFNTKFGAVDILGDVGGIRSYSDLRAQSKLETVRGVEARIAGIDHLIAMKRHAGRTKDKLMLEEYLVIADEQRHRDSR